MSFEKNITKDEVLKMALEALIWTTGSSDFSEGGQAYEGAKKCLFPVITEIKKALTQSEQEPVAYYHPRIGVYWAKPTRISAPTAVETALRYIKEREVLSTDQAKLNEKNK